MNADTRTPRRFTVIAIVFAVATLAVLLLAGRTSEAQAGQYLKLNGDIVEGHVEVAHDAALNPAAAMTLEVWVYQETYMVCAGFIGKDYTTGYWLGLSCSTAKFELWLANMAVGSDIEIPVGVWTHIAVTYDGTETRFYMNGQPDAIHTGLTGPIGQNTAPLWLGSDSTFDISPNGGIDEVRIWNVARTPAEIAANYAQTITAPETGLVAVFNFDGDFNSSVGGYTGTPAGDAGLESVDATRTPTATAAATVTATPPAETTTPTVTPGTGDGGKGDVTCDGLVDIDDAREMLLFAGGFRHDMHVECPGIGDVGAQGNVEFTGPALLFPAAPDGGYVEVPDDPALNPTDAITVEAWVRDPSTDFCQTFVGKSINSGWWLGSCDDHIVFTGGFGHETVAPLPSEEWTHVAGTYADGMSRIYINGNLDSENVIIGGVGVLVSDAPMRIGSDVDGSPFYSGQIDIVRIWNVARTQEQIRETMLHPAAPPGSGATLVAAYAFNGNALDASGNGHDGTLVGAVGYSADAPNATRFTRMDVTCNGIVGPEDMIAVLRRSANVPQAISCGPVGE